MMISTRGRYALRVLVDISIHGREQFVPIREVADRQEIPIKYLERIMPLLARANLVTSASGRGGGYKLALPPEKCKVGDVLRLTEQTLAPVACLRQGAKPCPRASGCVTLPMWKDFTALANRFFDGISIGDLAAGREKRWIDF